MAHKILISIIIFLISINLFPANSTDTSLFFGKAEFHKQNNDYVNAFQYYIKSLISAIEEKDDRMIMKCYGNLSIIYHDFGDLDNSLYYAHKGYEIAMKLGDKAQITFLSNFVSFYSQASDTVNASKYYQILCDMVSKQKNNIINGYFLIYERARLERAKKQFVKAVLSHKEARNYAIEHNMPTIYTLFQDSEIGNIMIADKDWNQALEIGKECLAIATTISEKDIIINSYKMIADAFNGLNVKDSSDFYMQKYYKLKNEVYDMSGFFRMQNNITQYNDIQTEGKINKLSNMVGIGFVIILVFTILIVSLIRKNTSLIKAQRMLINKNKELNKAEAIDNILRKKYVKLKEEQEKVINELSGTEQDSSNIDDINNPEDDAHDVQLFKEIQDKLLCKIISVFEDISIISDPDFSLSIMANKIGSNTKYVSMVINRTYNKNFKTLLNEYRIKEACRRMHNAEYNRFTIKAISDEVGFRNTASFIRCFKNTMGMPPSTYQKLSKEK